VRIGHVGDPVAHRLVDGVLQGAGAAVHRDDACPQQLHAVDVKRLSADVFGAHVNLAAQAQQSANRGCGHAMLARPGFGDDPGLSHAACQQRLTQSVVDLVGPGVAQILPFQIDLRPQLC
jgi:hypothetical protein